MTTQPDAPAHNTEPPRDIAEDARTILRRVADEDGLTVDMLAVVEPTSTAQTFEAPIDPELAATLLERCRDSARATAASELREAIPGFRPDSHQQVYTLAPDALRTVEDLAQAQTQPQLAGSGDLGRKNLLVIRVHTSSGDHLARFYQGLGSERDLQIAQRHTMLWNGGRFTQLDELPLILEDRLRVAVMDDIVVMTSSAAYERLFGPLPNLKEQAAATYGKTLAKLNIVGADELRAACETDINMMRKLASIERKLNRPGYADALTQAKLVAFVRAHPALGIDLDSSGPDAALVFTKHPQRRWQLLKLLDDDNLHSALTGIDYEANSKSELT